MLSNLVHLHDNGDAPLLALIDHIIIASISRDYYILFILIQFSTDYRVICLAGYILVIGFRSANWLFGAALHLRRSTVY